MMLMLVVFVGKIMLEVIEQMMLDDQMNEYSQYHVQQHQLKNFDE
jgi:hypothetical protein